MQIYALPDWFHLSTTRFFGSQTIEQTNNVQQKALHGSVLGKHVCEIVANFRRSPYHWITIDWLIDTNPMSGWKNLKLKKKSDIKGDAFMLPIPPPVSGFPQS